MNDRRLRDCYQSANPPTSQQFDRYLEDLTAMINYMRRAQGIVHYHELHYHDSPALPIIRRYPPRLCTQVDPPSDDE